MKTLSTGKFYNFRTKLFTQGSQVRGEAALGQSKASILFTQDAKSRLKELVSGLSNCASDSPKWNEAGSDRAGGC